MSESFAEYRARVLGYLGTRDPFRVLPATPGRLERLTRGQPRARLARKPAPDKWSVVEIVAYLADAELALGWRLRSMLAWPGVSLQWWDEYSWSQRCAYWKVPISGSLATFRALRAANLALLRRVTRASLEAACGVHDKRGRQTLRDFVVMEAAHDLNHLLQVQGALRRRPPGPRPSPGV